MSFPGDRASKPDANLGGMSGKREKRCRCGICRVSQALYAEQLDRRMISDGVDWMLDVWCGESMRFSHIMHVLNDEITAGTELPQSILAAFDLAAGDSIWQRHNNPLFAETSEPRSQHPVDSDTEGTTASK